MQLKTKKFIPQGSIIIFDDEITVNNKIVKEFKKNNKKVKIVKNSNDLYKSIKEENILFIILKYKLDNLSIKELVKKIQIIKNDIQFIVIDNFENIKRAVEIMKYGTKDLIIKQVNISENYINYFFNLIEEIEKNRKLEYEGNIIKDSFEKYQILVDKASEGIFVIQDEIIKFVNPRIIKYSGYSIDEILNKRFIDFIHQDDKELVLNNYKKRIKKEDDYLTFSVRFIDKNKNVKWVKINGVSINWEGNYATLNYLNDITENKKIEEKLRYSQEITQALLNATKDFAILMNVDGKLLAINEIAAKLHNKSVKELLGLSFFDLSPPYLVKYRKEIGNKVVRVKKPISYEEIHVERTYFNNIYPIMDEYGEVKRLAIYSHDITDYKKAVEAVKESEEKFKALLENSSDGIIIINKDGIIEYATPTVETVLGYKPEEILGKSYYDFVHNDEKDNVNKAIKNILKESFLKINIEFKAFHKDLSWRYIEAIGNNLYNNPIINGIVVTFRDITERKLAEEKLNIYKHIVSSSSDQMAFINKDCEILAVNNSFLKAFKYKEQEIVGRKLNEIYGEEEYNDNLKELCNKCFSGNEVTFEKWFDFPNLGKKYMVFSLYPYIENNKITGIVINTRDITERVQMETDIVDLQEKERQKIGIELHDGLSHYLLGIAIKSRMLAEKLKKNKMNEGKEAQEIETQINKAIEETRNLARGLFFIELEDKNIRTLLKNVKNDLENRYKINCYIEIDKAIEKIKNNVVSQFFYIIQEAVNNSVKHSKAKNIIICIKEKNEYLTLTITDDGIGIPDNLKNKNGMGINIMKYRARIIGASFDIFKGENPGTEVRCRLKKN